MRCKNCGWDNPNNNVQCEKCMAPLEKHDTDTLYAAGRTLPPTDNAAPDKINFNATLHENVSFCSSCGYRLRAGDASCPACGTAAGTAADDMPQPLEADTAESPEAPSGSLTETVNPWETTDNAPLQNIPACTLTPVAEDFPAQQSPASLKYAGSEIILNRNNTDPANATVSSHEQAALICDSGEWFIEDRSRMKTTFVRPRERMKLKDGDMILMGNRRFLFGKS
jgi:uncharacterized Zn finger protein (UPF0148 family)